MNAPADFSAVSALSAPSPALVVVSGGPSAAGAGHAGQAHDPAFRRLLNALPDARRVLELGCGAGELAKAYKAGHPGSHWTGVEGRPALHQEAARHMDQALCLDLQQVSVQALGKGFDLVPVSAIANRQTPQ